MVLLVVLALGQLEAAPAPAAEAKLHFVEGEALFSRGRYAEAGERFEASFALRRRASTAFNRARCAELVGDVPGAVGWYRWYLRLAVTARDRQDVERAIRELSVRAAASGLQVLTVFATPDEASVSVDDGPASAGWLSVALPPGAHRVRAAASGFTEVAVPLELPAGSAQVLTLSLEALPAAAQDAAPEAPAAALPPPAVPPLAALVPAAALPPPAVPPSAALVPEAAHAPPGAPAIVAQQPAAPPPAPRRLRWTWVAGGAAAAGAATATGLGLAATSTSDQLRVDAVLPPARVEQLAGDSRNLATGANVAWAVAATALVATAVAYLVER